MRKLRILMPTIIATFGMPFIGLTSCKSEVKEVKVQSITLEGISTQMTKNQVLSVSAKIEPDNATNKSVTWTSDNEEVATVTQDGDVSAINIGEATITVAANDGSGVSEAWTINVIDSGIFVTDIKINNAPIEMPEDGAMTLSTTITPSNATNKTITWSSSEPSIISVNKSTGEINAHSEGFATITATANGSDPSAPISDSVTIEVLSGIGHVESVEIEEGASDTLGVGVTKTLNPIIEPAYAFDKTVTWTSDNEEVAKVNGFGTITTLAPGIANITVKTNDRSKTDTFALQVANSYVQSVRITEGPWGRVKLDSSAGTTALHAEVSPSTAPNKSVTWSSSDATVASIDAQGNITPNSVGTTTITVTTTDGGKTDTFPLCVVDTSASFSSFDKFIPTVHVYTHYVGESFTPEYAIMPIDYDSDGDHNMWTSDDGSIVKSAHIYDSNFVCKKAGTTKIHLEHGSHKGDAEWIVNVIAKNPNGNLSIDQGAEAYVDINDTLELSCSLYNTDNGSSEVTWSLEPGADDYFQIIEKGNHAIIKPKKVGRTDVHVSMNVGDEVITDTIQVTAEDTLCLQKDGPSASTDPTVSFNFNVVSSAQRYAWVMYRKNTDLVWSPWIYKGTIKGGGGGAVLPLVLHDNEKYYFKNLYGGLGTAQINNRQWNFVIKKSSIEKPISDESVKASGNILSMSNGETYESSSLYKLFTNCTALTTPPQCFNKAGKMAYKSMFSGCKFLKSAPYLSATSLEEGCYKDMFNGCTSLKVSQDIGDEEHKIFYFPENQSQAYAEGMFANIDPNSPFKGSPMPGHTYYWVE